MTTLQFFGATRAVTGSCFLLQGGGTRVLVDCGLVQGSPQARVRNHSPFPFDPSRLDAVVLTHAHLDHSGLTPKLVAGGFRGRLLTTAITKDFLPILWEDVVHLQTLGSDRDDGPLYDVTAVHHALGRCEGHPYGQVLPLSDSCRIRFTDAGHILGSAIVEVWITDGPATKKFVFSGDLGQRGKPIVRDPAYVREADVLVMESTYGDRQHRTMAETVRELGDAIAGTLHAGGTVLMPVYAIGRSQDVLYMINQLTLEGVLDRPRVFLDSPMAIRSAHVYASHLDAFDEEALGLIRHPPKNPRAPRVQFTESTAASRALARMNQAIILAGSGMCEGGRIQAHLARHLGNPEACVIFTGYQVEGTLGRRLIDGARRVNVLGRMVPVKAKILTINGLSAHADQAGLLDWFAAFAEPKPQTYLVHGEAHSMTVLAEAIQRRFGLKATTPAWQDVIMV